MTLSTFGMWSMSDFQLYYRSWIKAYHDPYFDDENNIANFTSFIDLLKR